MSIASPAVRAQRHAFPVLRWCVLAWLAIYMPVYAHAYGVWHFLMLCNLGVLLTAAGILFDRPILLASQAVAAPGIFALWIIDAGARLAIGTHLHGGTAYMWDPSIPMLARVLSLFHLAWPFVLAWTLNKRGFDRRGLALQAVIATGAFVIAIVVAPQAENLQYVWHAPGAATPIDAPWPRAAKHLAVLVVAIYLPSWLLLRACFAPGGPNALHRFRIE